MAVRAYHNLGGVQLALSRELGGRYRLDEVIGSGATATVWRAWDRRLERAVAVKVLDGAGPGGGDDDRSRFRDEARTLARLSHPNIVAVLDSGMQDGVAHVVMELVEGHSAAWRLADGVMPVAEAAMVMAKVCDALAAAHAEGVVHRGIKPGNILLGPGRTVKVCDFGTARLLDNDALTSTYAVVGTSSYMSPEQVAGRPQDGRSDLYAVGCVLSRMFTGSARYAAEDAFTVAYQKIPRKLDRLVGRLLAADPKRRPATAAEVRDELLRWSDSAAVAPGSSRRRRRFVRRALQDRVPRTRRR